MSRYKGKGKLFMGNNSDMEIYLCPFSLRGQTGGKGHGGVAFEEVGIGCSFLLGKNLLIWICVVFSGRNKKTYLVILLFKALHNPAGFVLKFHTPTCPIKQAYANSADPDQTTV